MSTAATTAPGANGAGGGPSAAAPAPATPPAPSPQHWHCLNPACARSLGQIAPGAAPPRFCPYCAADQAADAAAGVLVLRAGENVWHFEEPEARVAPGKPRPLVVVDEQSVHLSHTDRVLEPEALLGRVRDLLARQQVPVNAELRWARWQNDREEERRARIVATLRRGTSYSDVRMILGVDYLGKWASVHVSLAAAPEPLPEPPSPPHYSLGWPIFPTLLALFALLVFGNGFQTWVGSWRSGVDNVTYMGWGGFLFACAVVWFLSARQEALNRRDAFHEQWRADWEEKQYRRLEERATERLSRTFKVDDMRLFASAMKEVFQAVVDDIVERSPNAVVARIEGGNGGFFVEDGVAQAAPAARLSDAAHAAV